MHVDATSIGLAFSAAGTIVVAVGAFVAVRQLRSIRHGNELATLTEFSAQFDAPEMIEACAFVRTELAAAMRDPAFLDGLRVASADPRVRHVMRVANFFESMGVFLHYGALSRDMTLTIWGVVVARHWALMRAAVAVCREERMVLRFFEDFAVRSDRWLRSAAFEAHLARLTRDDRRPALAESRPAESSPAAADER